MIGPVKGRTPALLAAIAFFAGAGTAHAQFTLEGSPYATGLAPYMAFAADFNRDGRPDVATTNGDGQTVSVFLRQPSGGFAGGVRLAVLDAGRHEQRRGRRLQR